jgi:hypothetical protein
LRVRCSPAALLLGQSLRSPPLWRIQTASCMPMRRGNLETAGALSDDGAHLQVGIKPNRGPEGPSGGEQSRDSDARLLEKRCADKSLAVAESNCLYLAFLNRDPPSSGAPSPKRDTRRRREPPKVARFAGVIPSRLQASTLRPRSTARPSRNPAPLRSASPSGRRSRLASFKRHRRIQSALSREPAQVFRE